LIPSYTTHGHMDIVLPAQNVYYYAIEQLRAGITNVLYVIIS